MRWKQDLFRLAKGQHKITTHEIPRTHTHAQIRHLWWLWRTRRIHPPVPSHSHPARGQGQDRWMGGLWTLPAGAETARSRASALAPSRRPVGVSRRVVSPRGRGRTHLVRSRLAVWHQTRARPGARTPCTCPSRSAGISRTLCGPRAVWMHADLAARAVV
jgi:hypothetical protein